MAATAETPASPAKLTPSERLLRKRAAARLRQQRCRARKRQAILEERRQQAAWPQQQKDKARDSPPRPPPAHDKTTVTQYAVTRPSTMYTIPRVVEREQYWRETPSPNNTNGHPTTMIQGCVSFDSQRSYEESQRSYEALQQEHNKVPMHRSSISQIAVVSPDPASRKSPHAVLDSPPKEKEGTKLVAKEEAAIAAMLSMRSGPSTEQTRPQVSSSYQPPQPQPPHQVHQHPQHPHPPQPPRTPYYGHRTMKVPVVSKVRYSKPWDAYQRTEAYEYPRRMMVPGYRMLPPPPPQHYRYQHSYEMYERYDYE